MIKCLDYLKREALSSFHKIAYEEMKPNIENVNVSEFGIYYFWDCFLPMVRQMNFMYLYREHDYCVECGFRDMNTMDFSSRKHTNKQLFLIPSLIAFTDLCKKHELYFEPKPPA